MLLAAALFGMVAQTRSVSGEARREWRRWRSCIAAAAAPEVDGQRKVESVVDEAMANCGSDERAMARLVVRDVGGRGAHYMRGFRNQMRLDAIRAIAAHRSRRTS